MLTNRARAYKLKRLKAARDPWKWELTLLISGRSVKGLFKTKKDALEYLKD